MFIVAIGCPFVWAIVGCSVDRDAKPSLNSDAKELKIGMIPKLETIPYFKACERGARDAAKELDVELVYTGPTDNDVEKQKIIVEEMIQEGFDVITLACCDPEAIAPVLKKARDRDIIVVTWDADANPEKSARNAFCNQAPTDGLAHQMVDYVAEKMGGKGKAVIVSTTKNAPNQNAWMSYMLPRLKEKYPNIELLETQYPDEDTSRAREKTAALLATNADLTGIWGLSSVALPGAAKAVYDAERVGQVAVTGVALPSDMREHVQNDTVEQFFLWNPEDLGYLSVYIAKRIKDGEFKEGTYDIGRVKGVQIKGTEVILGPPIIFTKENIDKYKF